MSEPLFRVGGVHLDQCGNFIRIAEQAGLAQGSGFYEGTVCVRVERVDAFGNYLEPHGYCRLDNGKNWRGGLADLMPGEIWFQSRQKVPAPLTEGWDDFLQAVTTNSIAAQPTPTLDKLEAEKSSEDKFDEAFARLHAVLVERSNAAMIARDGPAEPAAEPASKTHEIRRSTKDGWTNWESVTATQADYRRSQPDFQVREIAARITAHVAIPGLTRMSAQDHRLGMGIR